MKDYYGAFVNLNEVYEDLNNNGQYDNYDDWNIIDDILYCNNDKQITLYLDSCE